MVMGFFVFCCTIKTSGQDTSHVLKNVDVQAQQLPENGRSVVPMQQLKKDALNGLNSLSVADAVKYFSGVLVKDYGGLGGLKTISVRSLGANHTGVMYDGIMLSDAQGGQIDLGKLSLDNIEEINLYNGQPSGNICQPARSYTTATVLQLNTGLPVFKDDQRIKLNLGYKTGSFGLINPSATVHYRWSDKFYSSFNTEWQKANGEYPFTFRNGDSLEKMKRVNADIDAIRFELDNKLIFNDSNRIAVKAYFYKSERGLPGSIIINNPNSSQRLWDRIFFLQGNWSRKFKNSQLLVNAKYNFSYNRFLNPEYLNNSGRLDNTYQQREYYLSGSYAYNITSQLQVSYSADFITNTMGANTYNFAHPTRLTLLNVLAAKWKLQRLELQGNLLYTLVNDQVKKGLEPGNKRKLTPYIGASYQPWLFIPVRIRGYYKNIFRLPTFNDLYYTDLGNTNVKPEFAQQYDLGLTWQQNVSGRLLQAVSLTIDAYYNHVKDKIVALPGNLFQWRIQNYGKVDIKGLDAGIQLYFKPIGKTHISLKGNYTYQQATDLSNPSLSTYKNQLPYTPKNSGAANLGIEYKSWSFNYNALFSASRYQPGDNIPYNLLASWNTQDVSLSYLLPVKNMGKWKLSFELNNIFNQQYDIIKFYPMPGRSFRLGLNCKL